MRDVITPVHQRLGLGAEDHELRRANAGAVLHPLVDEVRRLRGVGTGHPHQVNGVTEDRLRDRHPPHEPVEGAQVVARDPGLQGELTQRGRGVDDLHLLVFGEVIDDDVEHEAVELGLRQRIGTFQLDRVLGREDEERLLQLVGPALDRHAVLLHRFEQRRLGLRRGPVDLVGEDDLGEDRPGHEDHLPLAGVLVLLDDVGAGDVARHQVGRELDAAELQVQDLGDGLDDQGLGQTRHAGQDAVAAHEEGHQHLVQHLSLADDLLGELGEDLLPACRQPRGQFDIRFAGQALAAAFEDSRLGEAFRGVVHRVLHACGIGAASVGERLSESSRRSGS